MNLKLAYNKRRLTRLGKRLLPQGEGEGLDFTDWTNEELKAIVHWEDGQELEPNVKAKLKKLTGG